MNREEGQLYWLSCMLKGQVKNIVLIRPYVLESADT